MWTNIEAEEFRKIVLSKLDDRDGTDYSKVQDTFYDVVDFYFPEKTYTGPDTQKIEAARKLFFEFVIKASVEATLEIINLQNQKVEKQLGQTKKSDGNVVPLKPTNH